MLPGNIYDNNQETWATWTYTARMESRTASLKDGHETKPLKCRSVTVVVVVFPGRLYLPPHRGILVCFLLPGPKATWEGMVLFQVKVYSSSLRKVRTQTGGKPGAEAVEEPCSPARSS